MSKQFVTLCYADRKIILTGGKLYIQNQDQGIAVKYMNDQINVNKELNIEFCDSHLRRRYPIIINHKPREDRIYIKNYSRNIDIEFRDKILDKCGSQTLINSQSIDYDNLILYDKDSDTRIELGLIGSNLEDSGANTEENATNRVLQSPYESSNTEDNYNTSDIIETLRISPITEEVGSGSYRVVFKVEDISKVDIINENDGQIIKVSDHGMGKETNRYEMATWQAVKGTRFQKYFCPITSIGPNHKYIVMKEADMDKGDVDTIKNKIINAFKTKSNKFGGWYGPDIADRNVGIYNGNVVLVDYPYGANIKLENKSMSLLEYIQNIA